MQHRRGFTLLEVIMAVAILGLGLTMIFSAQVGAFQSATTARNMGMATGLARCKMSEVEEHLLRDGFQETDETGTGVCCDGDDTPFRCTWKVEKPTFPDAKFGDLNLDANLGSAAPGGSAGAFGAIGLLAGAGSGASPLGGASGVADVAKTLAGANAGDPSAAAGGGIGAMAGMAMSIVYPSLKLLFEASTRRVTATITWREGVRELSFDVVQWFTMPQKGLAVDGSTPDDPLGTGSASSSSGSHSSSSGSIKTKP